MRFGYTAKVRGGPTEDEQRALMRELGIARIVDEGAARGRSRPERDDLVSIMRTGDEIAVVSASLAAHNAGDLFAFVADLTARGAALYVIDQEQAFTASASHAALARAFVRDKNVAQIAPARAKRKNKGGRKPKLVLEGEALAVFKRMWSDPDTDIAAMQRRFENVSRHTISRRARGLGLGPKA